MTPDHFATHVGGWIDGVWPSIGKDYPDEIQSLRDTLDAVDDPVPLTLAPPPGEPLTPEVMRACGFTSFTADADAWLIAYSVAGRTNTLTVSDLVGRDAVVTLSDTDEDTVRLRPIRDAAQLRALLAGLGLPTGGVA